MAAPAVGRSPSALARPVRPAPRQPQRRGRRAAARAEGSLVQNLGTAAAIGSAAFVTFCAVSFSEVLKKQDEGGFAEDLARQRAAAAAAPRKKGRKAKSLEEQMGRD